MYTTITVLALALATAAAPVNQATELQFVKRNGVSAPFYFPETTTKAFPVDNEKSLLPVSDAEAVKIGRDALLKEFKLKESDVLVKQFHRDNFGVLHVYGVRLINDIPVDNNSWAVHLKDGKVVSLSSTFTGGAGVSKRALPPKVVVSLDQAVKNAIGELGVNRDDFPATLAYIQLPSGQYTYAHQFQLKNDDASKWYHVSVDAATGKVVQVVDYVQKATFKAIQLPAVDVRDGFTTIVDPEVLASSPKGWNNDGTTAFTDTQGNNVDSNIKGVRTSGGATLNFTHEFDPAGEPSTTENKKAATINNFYVSNMVHDITYQYGFDEKSGNFQTNNFGKGGKGGDRVKVNNQASGSNNANFATPPDGQAGVMNMYTWTFNTPKRDGSLDNGVPIHEYGHGVSNRLTGGSFQGNCLQNTESGGMGEGWSDTLAMYLTRKPTDTRETDYVLGAYVYNNPKGIRKNVYSTNTTTNPYTYNSVQPLNQVHAIGEIWATFLNEMYWNLVDKLGYSSNLLDAKQVKGNIVALQLVIGGMKLQPCNPTFLNARDAIIQADATYYGGAYKCDIWKAFAKRGMGVDAKAQGKTNGFALPAGC
ncbi:Fungalysin metallopeptidase-domain-containing protein [Globomyces pollinis-pini]|nr:Fungalysin metallopeptidase-domain-containing protein [Globomyces pollinis-pini]